MRLLRFLGPATIVSVAYIDPGNFGANIEAGRSFGFALLWVVLLSGFLAIAIQYVAGMVGIARGVGLLSLMARHKKWFTPVVITIVLATDMAEYMGVILGLHLLFGIPIEMAAVVGVIDVVILAILADKRELFVKVIGSMVVAVGVSFIVQLYYIKPELSALAAPSLTGEAALVAAAIVGATIMPHAVLLHSHLAVGQARREHLHQTAFNLFGVTFINAAILITSAQVLHGVDADIQDVPRILEPLYGPLSAMLFSLALLFAGISSSAVSVEVGVLAARYLFDRRLNMWKARLAARGFNLMPAVLAVGALGASPLEILVYTQAALAATLPVILVVLWYFARGVVNRWLSIATAASAVYAGLLVIMSLF